MNIQDRFPLGWTGWISLKSQGLSQFKSINSLVLSLLYGPALTSIHDYWKKPLEKETATHSSILAWEIPWTEEPGSYNPRGCKESDTTVQLSTQTNPNRSSAYSRGSKNDQENCSLNDFNFLMFICLRVVTEDRKLCK